MHIDKLIKPLLEYFAVDDANMRKHSAELASWIKSYLGQSNYPAAQQCQLQLEYLKKRIYLANELSQTLRLIFGNQAVKTAIMDAIKDVRDVSQLTDHLESQTLVKVSDSQIDKGSENYT